MPTPDLDVANHLASTTAPDLGTVGTDIFRGAVRPADPPRVPHAAIFCLATGGPAPAPYLAGSSRESFYRVNVQVRVRGNVGGFGAGQAVALQVRDKLHLASLTGYVRCSVEGAHPIYLGRDDTDHDEWSVNASLWFKT